jgi:glycosyltransferase involved in cell wall biosynthesis
MSRAFRFSIVIPAWNAERTILVAVDSCLAQSEPPHEIIVVDDGSTDGTNPLLEGRFGDRIILLRQDRNSGPSAARNLGIAAATGTHIAFQDADDIWHPEKLSIIRSVLESNPGVRFLFHPYTLASAAGSIPATDRVPTRFPLWKLLLSNPIGTPCVVIDCSIIEPFDERLHYMEDYELFLRLAGRHGVHRINAPLTQVGRPILSQGGQSSRRWKMRLGEMQAWSAFARQHPAYWPLVPVLSGFALLKHGVKALLPVRTNY